MATLPPDVMDLAEWVDETIDDHDRRAAAVLSAATGLVRGYAGKAWEGDDVPADVVAITVQVAARVWRNPTGAVQWTRGPFSERYSEAVSYGLFLTDEEKAALDRFRVSVSGIGTISMAGGGPASDTVYVPTGPPPSGYPFPWYAADGL